MKAAVYTSPSGLKHEMGAGHPECPGRLERVLEVFREHPAFKNTGMIEAEKIVRKDLLLAHEATYIDEIEHAVPQQGYAFMDGDTALNPWTLEAAYHAAGAGIKAVEDALTGLVDRAFVAVRPPGHHAEPDCAMGFCFFNNIFLAARYAQQKHSVNSVLILDFDVHHGNGTETMTRRHQNIYFISTHQMPLFPGSGDPGGNIAQKIRNIPLEAGTTSSVWRHIYEQQVWPEIVKYRPELLLVSAGFDAHREDPLAQINLGEEDFGWLGREISSIANQCHCPVVSFLEGGYHLDALKQSILSYARANFY